MFRLVAVSWHANVFSIAQDEVIRPEYIGRIMGTVYILKGDDEILGANCVAERLNDDIVREFRDCRDRDIARLTSERSVNYGVE